MHDIELRAMRKRMSALETRVAELENKLEGLPRGGEAERAIWRSPEFMDKTRAAEALGVTRATVYAMIADGRLEQNALGKVLTESVVALLQPGSPGGRWKKQKTLRMGADDNETRKETLV